MVQQSSDQLLLQEIESTCTMRVVATPLLLIVLCLLVSPPAMVFGMEPSWLQVYPDKTRTVGTVEGSEKRFGEARFFIEGAWIHVFWSEKENEDATTWTLWHRVVQRDATTEEVPRSATRLGQCNQMSFQVVHSGDRFGVSWIGVDYTIQACELDAAEKIRIETMCTHRSIRGWDPVYNAAHMVLLWTSGSDEEAWDKKQLGQENITASRAHDLPLQIRDRLHRTNRSIKILDCRKKSTSNDPRTIFTDKDLSYWVGDYTAFFELEGDICFFAYSWPGDEKLNAQLVQYRYDSAVSQCRRLADWKLTHTGSWKAYINPINSKYHLMYVDVPDITSDPVPQHSSLFWCDATQPDKRVCVWEGNSDGLEPAVLHDGVFQQHPEGTRGLLVWTGCSLRKGLRRSMVSKLSKGQWQTAVLQSDSSPSSILLASESAGFIGYCNDKIYITPFTVKW
jgi:hypothetical protein